MNIKHIDLKLCESDNYKVLFSNWYKSIAYEKRVATVSKKGFQTKNSISIQGRRLDVLGGQMPPPRNFLPPPPRISWGGQNELSFHR